MAKILKWTNKYSNEQGYVKSVKKADGHFVSTNDASEAKGYARNADVTKALKVLEEIGECENNHFEAVEVTL